MSSLLADLVLVVHFAFVLFVVGGLPLIWIGAAAGWRWVRGFGFRCAHLGAIVFVAAEAVVGMACPLTLWEAAARGGMAPESFIGEWIQRLLFYRAPPWVFTTAYVAWALATLATLRLVPPRRKAR